MPAFLHVGCGNLRKNQTTPGFNTAEWSELRFDINEAVRPDIVGTMTEMSAVADGSVDAVYSSHNIEHLYPHEVPVALGEFLRVLKPDGFLVMACPDLQSVARLIAEDRLTDAAYTSPAGPIAPIDILYGHRPDLARGNLYMAHRCGFTQKVLTAALKDGGFRAVAVVARKAPHFDLRAVASKSVRSAEQMHALVTAHFSRTAGNQAMDAVNHGVQSGTGSSPAVLSQRAHRELAALFNAGRYAAAESQARRLLERHPASGLAWKLLGAALTIQGKDGLPALQQAADLLPGDAEAHNNLGIALMARRRLDDAVASFRRALKIQPDYADACNNLGNALKDLGRLDEAVASYRRSVEIQPERPDAHNNLGNALIALGRPEAAMTSYLQALEIQPDFDKAHGNLGSALMALGRPQAAAASYRRSLEINPDYHKAHSNLGNALMALGSLDEAVASYRRALEIQPDDAKVCGRMGGALMALGRLEEAAASYRRGLEIQPDDEKTHSNLGVALMALGRRDEAVASYRRALEIKPDYDKAYNNLGIALTALGRFDEAVASCRRALEIKPDSPDAYRNLGNAQRELGRLDDAVESYRRALQARPDDEIAQSNLLFVHNYLSDKPAEMLLSEARRYGRIVARQARAYADWNNLPDPDRCLRIGWVSGDLRNHAAGFFFESVLAALAAGAAGRLEHFAYPTFFRSDALSDRIRACCQGWHSAVGLSDEHLAARIRDDGVDILIDLSGHTAHNRLPMFAWKPAPLQVSWLGYFATTGVAEIDYLIADPLTLPACDEIHFTEKIWRLPETRLCFTPPALDVPVSPLPALSAGHVTFGCFNNLTKVNDAVVSLWARILRAAPGSRLFLKAKQLGDAAVRQNVLDRFAAHGIEGERLILEGASPRAEYLAAYGRVDLALDPFPYTGGATSAESLWMGVPVLTLAGDRFVSRQGVGLMMNAGLADWVAADADDYAARALSHAGDIQRLAALRDGLRQQVTASPVFDAARFAKHFEAGLRGMWVRWCERRPGQAA